MVIWFKPRKNLHKTVDDASLPLGKKKGELTSSVTIENA
jgi:hypothetical protein